MLGERTSVRVFMPSSDSFPSPVADAVAAADLCFGLVVVGVLHSSSPFSLPFEAVVVKGSCGPLRWEGVTEVVVEAVLGMKLSVEGEGLGSTAIVGSGCRMVGSEIAGLVAYAGESAERRDGALQACKILKPMR